MLGKRYEIDPENQLVDLNIDQGTMLAASAVDGGKAGLMALVSRSASGGRTDVLTQLRNTESSSILALQDAGIATFGEEGQRFVMIYEKPQGSVLMPDLKAQRRPMTEDEIVRSVITPGVNALRELSQRGVFHGAVRPSNMYYSLAGNNGIILGDCAATLPSLYQPAIFETVERGMAMSAGRGNGTVGEDLYALGVSVVFLLAGRNPLREYADQDIIRLKMEKGSYSALTQDIRVPSLLLEPLRAMLCDDAKYRWSCDDFALWLSGRRLTPIQAHVPRRAQRPIQLGTEEYWLPDVLSLSMPHAVSHSMKLIEGGELDRWLLRSLGDKNVADKVRDAIDSAGSVGRGANFEDRAISRVCTALHPEAPMRLRDCAVLPAAFGNLLGHIMAQEGDASALIDMLKGQIALFWYNAQEKFKPEYMPAIKQFDQARAMLLRNGMGYGLERVAYDLCPTLPCLSPLFSGHIVLKPAEVIYALDHIAASSDRPKSPIDRHIAAFLAVRDKRVSDDQLGNLQDDPTSLKFVNGALSLLAGVQKRHNCGPQRNLAKWFLEMLDPGIKQFRKRERREKVKEALSESAENGSLAELLAIISNQDLLRRDLEEFSRARGDYKRLNAEAKKYRRQLEKRKLVEEGPGRETAALISGMGAIVLIAGILLYNVTSL